MSSGWKRSTAVEKFDHFHVSSYSGRNGLGFSETAILSKVHMGTKKNKISHNTPGLKSP